METTGNTEGRKIGVLCSAVEHARVVLCFSAFPSVLSVVSVFQFSAR